MSSATFANGRLPASKLARVHHPSKAVFLRQDAAVAWEAMRRRTRSAEGVDLYPLGPASAYRTYAQQQYFWDQYQRGGNVAARPGTSNHGWGLAVDVATPGMADAIRRHGGGFGWSWDEGQRVGEWWHFRYVGGYRPDPLAGLRPGERRLAEDLLRLRRVDKPTAAQVRRRKAAWRALRDQRKRIWRAAQEDGWERAQRRRRYAVLQRLTAT